MIQLDARLSTGLPSHPKTKKLVRRIGQGGAWCLVCLILWARTNRPDGDLAGMSIEDIELAADWAGKEGDFVDAMLGVRFLEGDDGSFRLHDWAEHQPWAVGAEARSEKSRWAALCKQHGRREAEKLMPEYAARLLEASQSHATGTQDACPSGSAPSPSPSPTSKEESTPTAAPAAPEPDPLWGTGLSFLLRKGVKEKSAREVIGLVKKELGDLATAELLAEAEAEDITEPRAWLIATARARKARAGPASRRLSASESVARFNAEAESHERNAAIDGDFRLTGSA